MRSLSLERIFHIIDRISDTVGKNFCYTIPLIMLLTIIEVAARYFFRRPTQWIWPVDTQLMTLCFALAGCYTMANRMHVRVDIIYSRFSGKRKAFLDLFGFIVAISFLCLFLWSGISGGLASYRVGEADLSGFEPPIWHMKLIVIPIGIILLLMQTVVFFTRSIKTAFGGKSQ